MKKFLATIAALTISLLVFSQVDEPSLLSEGNWYKLKVVQPGVYRLTFSHLNNMGIHMPTLDPTRIRIFGNGGGMLPHPASAVPDQDFEELAIYVSAQQSGTFNFFDYILFYAQGPTTIKYDEVEGVMKHQLNLYADTAVYFLNINQAPGKRLGLVSQSTEIPDAKVTTYYDLVFHEAENVNLLKVGREWFGEEFTDNTPQNFSFEIPGLENSLRIAVTWRVAASSTADSYFNLYLNGNNIDTLDLGGVTNPLGPVRTATGRVLLDPLSTNLDFAIDYNFTEPGSKGWLDYLAVSFQRDLRMRGEQFRYRNPDVVGPDQIIEYTITDGTDDLMVWEITDPYNTARVETTFSYETRELSFIIPNETLREFISFSPREYMVPVQMSAMPNQNIRGMSAANMLIITHPSFLTEAQELAGFHSSHSGLTVNVIDVKMVYNEFSSGQQDVVAIRNMIRYFYDKAANAGQSLDYVLMFGMGSYDYKNRIVPNSNLVPAYNSLNSTDPMLAYSSDDFFASIGDGKGDWDVTSTAEPLDVAIGRLPARTAQQAKDMVDKIIHYATNPDRFGSWRNVYTLVADDGDNGIFMSQAESLSGSIENNNPDFNIRKIYLDEYEIQQTPDGPRYPAVNEAIKQALNQGTMVFNYVGHSGPEGLAEEKVLTSADIQALSNHNKLPLFIVMGSKYVNISDPGEFYQGNDLMLQDEQGAVAVIAPNSYVYASPNAVFNATLTNFMHTNSGPPVLGKIMKQTKNEFMHVQNRRHTLLGDPAMHLTLPDNVAVIDSVIGIAYQVFADTLAPGQPVVIKGSVIDGNGNVISGFNGNISLTVFERPVADTTRGNQNDPFIYTRQEHVMLTSENTVQDGKFTAQFQLPVDISRNYGNLKLSWYASGTNTDAAGAHNLLAGGGPFGTGPGLDAARLVRIYPTLTSDRIFVDFVEQSHNFHRLALLNMAGSELLSRNLAGNTNVQLSLGHLPRGSYILVIRGEAGIISQKVTLH